jgi:hypothetical protein
MAGKKDGFGVVEMEEAGSDDRGLMLPIASFRQVRSFAPLAVAA